MEQTRVHPSDILDYFIPKDEVRKNDAMEALKRNYLDKHAAVQRTAQVLLTHDIPVIPAPNLHP
jgi:hypothetical protein